MSVTNERIDPPVCIALDTADLDVARRLLDALKGLVPVFKVGLELFCAHGPVAVHEVLDRGADVFLDMKINDIPKQSAGAVRAAQRMSVTYLTVHANAGRATVRACVDAAGERGPKLLVVSVLTSLDDSELAELGVAGGTSAQVDAMARLATEEGAPGLVLAAGEVARVRQAHPGLFLLTPGIRPAGTALGDQRRVGTPATAVADGADLLVLGRAVTQAPDPVEATKKILEEIDAARVPT
jgi:orotidine-5'-phosphate decarboxylase